jgi:hypothetical protein
MIFFSGYFYMTMLTVAQQFPRRGALARVPALGAGEGAPASAPASLPPPAASAP